MTKEGLIAKRALLYILSIFVIFAFVGVVVAANKDVAYIYEKEFRIDENFIEVFEDLNLSVDLIRENEVSRTDFDEYKFIFVGDEVFTHPELIPVGEVPTIIANYYHGPEWGLTDNEGVSQLGSNRPLSVFKDGREIRVYTVASDRNGAVAYYYIFDRDKAPALKTIARTDGLPSGGGDVVTKAEEGDRLLNGKILDGDVCFYGIIESKYWTPAARDILKECIDVVFDGDPEIECDMDSDCGIDGPLGNEFCSTNNTLRQKFINFTCMNPGEENSFCKNETTETITQQCLLCVNDQCVNPELNCETDDDCGIDGFVGEEFCTENNVMKNFRNVTCNNANTTNSFCTTEVLPTEVDQCEFACFDGGICVRCNEDNDCDDNNSSTSDRCLNPGTAESRCENFEGIPNETLIHDVGFINFTNSVNNIKIEYENGTSVKEEDLICNNKYQIIIKVKNFGNFTEDVTFNGSIGTINFSHIAISEFLPGQVSAEKVRTVNVSLLGGNYKVEVNTIIEDDDNLGNNWALRNVEVMCSTNQTIQCDDNSDCGETRNSSLFCSGINSMINTTRFVCNNPGTAESFCSSSTQTNVVEQCSFMCVNGECIDIPVENNLTCVQAKDQGLLFATIQGGNVTITNNANQSFEVGVAIYKRFDNSVVNQTLFDSEQKTIENHSTIAASVDRPQCAYQIEAFCGGVLQNFTDEVYGPRIINATFGGTGEFCEKETMCGNSIKEGTEQCDDGNLNNGDGCSSLCEIEEIECEADSDCDDNNPLTLDQCINANTTVSECRNTGINCANDLDCGTNGFVGQEYCSDDNVTKNFQTAICHNDGTTESFCTLEVSSNIVHMCSNACYNGVCVICNEDDDCDDNNVNTDDVCVNPGVLGSFCKNN